MSEQLPTNIFGKIPMIGSIREDRELQFIRS